MYDFKRRGWENITNRRQKIGDAVNKLNIMTGAMFK